MIYKPETCERFHTYERDFQLTRNQHLLEISRFNHEWPSEGRSFVKISKIEDQRSIFSSCFEVFGQHIHGEVISSSSMQPKIIDSVLAKSDILETGTLPVYFKHCLALKRKDRVLVEVLNGQNLVFAQEVTLQVPTEDLFDLRALPSLVKVGMNLPYLVEDSSHLVYAGLFSSTETAQVINIKPTGFCQWYLIDAQTKIKVTLKLDQPYTGNYFSIYKTPPLVLKRSPTLARTIKLITQIGKFSNVLIRGQSSDKIPVARAVAWKLKLRFSLEEMKADSLIFTKEPRKEFLVKKNNRNLVIMGSDTQNLSPEIEQYYVCVNLDLPGLQDRTVVCEQLNNLYNLEINLREMAVKTEGRTVEEIIQIFKDIRIFSLPIDDALSKLRKLEISKFDLRGDLIEIVRCGHYRGIVLYGNGNKEELAEIIARDLDMNFASVKAIELANDLYNVLGQCSGIVFIEELDILIPCDGSRTDLRTKLLSLMREEQSNVFIIASTDNPCLVDPRVFTPEGFGAVFSFNSQEDLDVETQEGLADEIGARCDGFNSAFYKIARERRDSETVRTEETDNLSGDYFSTEANNYLAP